MRFSEKIEGMPTVYYISLEESEDRRKYMTQQMADLGVDSVPFIVPRYEEGMIDITGSYLEAINTAEKGVGTSHLLNMYKWYNETDEEYAIFTEDDIDFSTIEYWNFTWKDFMSRLPKGWESVQLVRINPFQTMNYEEQDGLKIRKRTWCDWGCTCLINRETVGKILEKLVVNEKKMTWNLDWDLHPFPENLIYYSTPDCVNKVWSFPLFVENVLFKTTFMKFYETDGYTHEFDHIHGAKIDQYLSSKYYTQQWVTHKEKQLEGIGSMLVTDNPEYTIFTGISRRDNTVIID